MYDCMVEIKEKIINKIKSLDENIVKEISDFRDELTLTIQTDKIVEAGKLLKEDPELEFVFCEDVTAIDWARKNNRFTVVYHVYSYKHNFRLRLKIDLENDTVDSVTSVWASANWYERETFDMYGIKFNNHPDLRRVYMPEEFEYYPLRKEFPVIGIPGSIPLPPK